MHAATRILIPVIFFALIFVSTLAHPTKADLHVRRGSAGPLPQPLASGTRANPLRKMGQPLKNAGRFITEGLVKAGNNLKARIRVKKQEPLQESVVLPPKTKVYTPSTQPTRSLGTIALKGRKGEART